jgi:hypothetical protein
VRGSGFRDIPGLRVAGAGRAPPGGIALIMGLETLARMLRPMTKLRIICKCGHDTGWMPDQAIRKFGPGAAPRDIRRKARCLGCGKLGEVEIFIEPWTPPELRAKVANDVQPL